MVLPTEVLERKKKDKSKTNKQIYIIILHETVLNPYINEHKQLYVGI